MGKTEEDWNGLKLGFLNTVQPNSFSKLIPAACNFKINAQETYLFVSDPWFCHLPVIFFAYFKFHSDWGRVIGKIKENELDCRDTAPLILACNRSNLAREKCSQPHPDLSVYPKFWGHQVFIYLGYCSCHCRLPSEEFTSGIPLI